MTREIEQNLKDINKQLAFANELKIQEISLKWVEMHILNGKEINNLEEIAKKVENDIKEKEKELGINGRE